MTWGKERQRRVCGEGEGGVGVRGVTLTDEQINSIFLDVWNEDEWKLEWSETREINTSARPAMCVEMLAGKEFQC